KIQIPTIYHDAVVVPQEATFEQQGRVMIFKLGENNKVVATILETKANIDNLYVIESGVKIGDKIVVTGVGKLKNDMPITPQSVPFDSIIKPLKPLFKN